MSTTIFKSRMSSKITFISKCFQTYGTKHHPNEKEPSATMAGYGKFANRTIRVRYRQLLDERVDLSRRQEGEYPCRASKDAQGAKLAPILVFLVEGFPTKRFLLLFSLRNFLFPNSLSIYIRHKAHGTHIHSPRQACTRFLKLETNRTLPFSKFVFLGLQDQLRGDRNIMFCVCVRTRSRQGAALSMNEKTQKRRHHDPIEVALVTCHSQNQVPREKFFFVVLNSNGNSKKLYSSLGWPGGWLCSEPIALVVGYTVNQSPLWLVIQ